jgi:putative membrane protein
MMWYSNGGMQWWGWLLGALGMVAFWGLIIWAVWYFVTGQYRRPGQDSGSPADSHRSPGDARRILDERLARGEIDAEEYRRLRDLVGGYSGTPDGQPPVATGGQR